MQQLLDAYLPYRSLQRLFRLTALNHCATTDCFTYQLDAPLLSDGDEKKAAASVLPANMLLQCAQSFCAQFTLLYLQRDRSLSHGGFDVIEEAQAPHPMATHFLQPAAFAECIWPCQLQVKVLRKGRSVSFCEVHVLNADETILAQSNHTFAL